MSKKRSIAEWFFGSKKNDQFEVIVNNVDECSIEYLKSIKYDDVAFFHLNGYEAYAKIVSQYDGDTMCLVFFLNGKIVKFRCRLACIDCAEKKSSDPYEVKCALQAIDRVGELVGRDKIVYAKFKKFDKYGRLLVHVYSSKDSEYSINDILVGEGLAYEYHGGKRVPFREWAHSSFYEGEVGYIDASVGAVENAVEDVVDNINDSEVLEFAESNEPMEEMTNISLR